MKKNHDNRKMQVSWIMSRPVEAVRMKDPLQEVAFLFTEKNIGAAAVLDENKKPVGVITKTDLARYNNKVDEEDAVEHWMTPVIFSVKPETSIKEIARRMVKYGVHHIFVRGSDGEPIVGVVSSFDILKHVASQEVGVHDRT